MILRNDSERVAQAAEGKTFGKAWRALGNFFIIQSKAPFKATKTSVSGLRYHMSLKARTLMKRSNFTIAFTPSRPRPSHLIWSVNRRAGGRLIKDPHKADAVFFFENKTAPKALRRPNPLAPGFNFFCEDLSAPRIAQAFRRAFGYDIAVEPSAYIGDIVVKSERNGHRDSRIIRAPFKPKGDFAYQRLIDTELQPGFVTDFCCPTVKGEVPLIYVKARPKDARFSKIDSHTALVDTENVLRPEERAQISRFCADIGLDWGCLNVLRDKNDGRIYIVGVNKNDIGPPRALPFKDKLRSVDILAASFKDAVLETPALIAGHVPADNDRDLDAGAVPVRIAP